MQTEPLDSAVVDALAAELGDPTVLARLVRLYLGDVAGYRDLCRQMQQRFADDSSYVVRTCILDSEAVPQLAEIVRRAEKAPDARATPAMRTQVTENLAFALYRAGRFDEARRAAHAMNASLPRNWLDLALYEQAATYVDKILKGATPARLPVEQPSQFQVTVNNRTAQALGLSISPRLAAVVDEVID